MNTFKKPYNPNIRKTFPSIVAPVIVENNEKIAQLFSLVEQGNISEVKKFILTTRIKLNYKFGDNDESVLHRVLMIDDLKMPEYKKLEFIDCLVSNGAYVNSYDKYNVTPLHLAVQKKYPSIVKYFIEQKGANPNAQTLESLTPLHYAMLMNIKPCPPENLPQDLIPEPPSKNIDFNEVIKSITRAFLDEKSKFLHIKPWVKYDNDGETKLIEDGNTYNPIDDYDDDGNPLDDDSKITTDLSSVIFTDMENAIKPIANLIKYNGKIIGKIEERIKNKISDKKTDLTTTNLKDILNNFAADITGEFVKSYSIKGNITDQLDEILDDRETPIDNYTAIIKRIEQVHKSTIKTSIEKLNAIIANYLIKALELVAMDLKDSSTKLWTEKEYEVTSILASVIDQEYIINKLKNTIKTSLETVIDQDELGLILIRQSIEVITNKTIENYELTISNIKRAIEEKTPINNSNNEISVQINTIIPYILALKDPSPDKTKIINWYFNNMTNIMQKLNTNYDVDILILTLSMVYNHNLETKILESILKIMNIYTSNKNKFENLNKDQIVHVIEYIFAQLFSLDKNYFGEDNQKVNDIKTQIDIIVNLPKNVRYNELICSLNSYYNTKNNLPNSQIRTINYDIPPISSDSVSMHKLNYVQPNELVQWDQIYAQLQNVDIQQIKEIKGGLVVSYGTILSNLSSDKNEALKYLKNFISESGKDHIKKKFIESMMSFIYTKTKQAEKQINIKIIDSLPTDKLQYNEWIANQVAKYELQNYIMDVDNSKLTELGLVDIAQPNLITTKIENTFKTKELGTYSSNFVQKFVKLLETQGEFINNTSVSQSLVSEDYSNFNSIFKHFESKMDGLISAFENLKGDGEVLTNTPQGAGVGQFYGGNIFTIKNKIIGDGNYWVILAGPVPGLNFIIGDYNFAAPNIFNGLGNQNQWPSQKKVYKKYFDLYKKIKEFRSVIKNNFLILDLRNGDCYGAGYGAGPNYVLEASNFFQAQIDGLDALGVKSNNHKIQNIYINNIALLIGLLHYAFDNKPGLYNFGGAAAGFNYQPTTNLNNGTNSAVTVTLTDQKPLELEQTVNQRNQLNSIDKYPDSIYVQDPQFNKRATYGTNIPSLKKWLFNLNIIDSNITNTDFESQGGAGSPAHTNVKSDNQNAVLTKRETLTNLPYGLLDVQQGCLVNILKFIANKINEKYNEIFTEESYDTIVEEISSLLKMFKLTVLVLIKYQLFCAIPCPELFEQLQNQIKEYSFDMDLVPITDQTETLIKKMNKIIHEQKILRARSVTQIIIDNFRVFCSVYDKLQLTQVLHQPLVELSKSAHIVFKLYDIYNQREKNYSVNYNRLMIEDKDKDNTDTDDIYIEVHVSNLEKTIKINSSVFSYQSNLQLPNGKVRLKQPTCLAVYNSIAEKLTKITPDTLYTPNTHIELFKLDSSINQIKEMNICTDFGLDLYDYKQEINLLHKHFIYDQIKSDSNLNDLADIDLSYYNFNPKNFGGDFGSVNTSKQEYLASIIDKQLIKYIIAAYLKKVNSDYIFVDQPYYKDAFKLLKKFMPSLPDKIAHDNTRMLIFSTWEKFVIDGLNNSIDNVIKQIIIKGTSEIISIDVLKDLDFSNTINIYLPSSDYSFGLRSFAKELFKKVEQTIDISQTELYALNFLDTQLIEDEDYDINYNLSNGIINSKKRYPIFYSYNYDNKDIGFDCVIYDLEIIEILIKKADINIKDHTGKTIIDYLVEGKMYYLLDSEKIKKRLVEKNIQNAITKSIENEKSHNKLFGYTNNSIMFVDNYVNSFITKLKNTDEIKSNIPINIRNIFKAYLCIQNIYWFRLCNKLFHSNLEYQEIFGIKYFVNKLQYSNDWKKIFEGIQFVLTKTSSRLVEKEKSKLEKSAKSIDKMSNKSSERKAQDDSTSMNNLNKTKQKFGRDIISPLIDLSLNINNESDLPEDKTLKFFREYFNKLNEANGANILPIAYTYIWDNYNDYSKNYFIHLQVCSILDKLFEESGEMNKKTVGSLSIVNTTLTTQTTKTTNPNLISTINRLTKFVEPISEFVDGRLLDKTLESNPMLLFQVRTITHILTTFIGSNMYMFFQKLLVKDYKDRSTSTKTYEQILSDISNNTKDLKEYILTDKLDLNYLTFQFVKQSMGFKVKTIGDLPFEKDFDDIFGKIITLLPFSSNNTDSTILENIKTSVIPYYVGLYKEILDQLLNFSDSYYRFVKNQYQGILTLKKILL